MAVRSRRRSIGIALGAGGARGLAHIGVLKALTRAGIPIDAIAGTSSGALVGAAYAAGQLENFEERVRALEWTDVAAMWDPIWPRSGLMSGKRAADRLSGFIGDWKIQDLAIPFAAVSVDLMTGDEILIERGKVADAIRASISIPGVFVPHREGQRMLVDGAVRNPVPVSALDHFDVDLRIAVNLHPTPVREIPPLPSASRRRRRSSLATRASEAIETGLSRFRKLDRKQSRTRVRERLDADDAQADTPNLFEIMTATMSIIEYELARHRLALDPPDVLIAPEVKGVRSFEFHKAAEAIDAGERAVDENLDEIRAALRRRRRRRAS